MCEVGKIHFFSKAHFLQLNLVGSCFSLFKESFSVPCYIFSEIRVQIKINVDIFTQVVCRNNTIIVFFWFSWQTHPSRDRQQRARYGRVVGMGNPVKGNQQECGRSLTRSNSTRWGRATTRTHGLTPSWRNSWWRWPVSVPVSFVSGFKINGAKIKRRRFSWNRCNNKKRYIVFTIIIVTTTIIVIITTTIIEQRLGFSVCTEM